MLEFESILTAPLDFVRDDANSIVYYGIDLGGAFLKLGSVGTGRFDKWQALAEKARAEKKSAKSSK